MSQNIHRTDSNRPALISEDSSTAQSNTATPRNLVRCALPSSYPDSKSQQDAINKSSARCVPQDRAPPQSNRPAATSSMDYFEFASLSPGKAAEWEEAQNSKRQDELKRRLERKMALHAEDDDSLDEFEEFSDEIWNAKQQAITTNRHGATSAAEEASSASSLPPQSTPGSKLHNWDIDTLLDEQMKDIDDCDFGSLNCQNLGLGQQQQQQKQLQTQKQQQRQSYSAQQTQQSQMQRRHSDVQNQSAYKINNAEQSPSRMAQITVCDQSTISSPGQWSAVRHAYSSATLKPSSATVGNSLANTGTRPPTSQTNQSPATQFRPLSAPQTPRVSSDNNQTELQTKLHALQLQLNQVTTLNSTLRSRANNDQLQIQQLRSSEEEARQQAALWEAKWHDDVGAGTSYGRGELLQDLRGALLQKTKEEVRVLQSKLMEVSRSRQQNDSVEMNLLATENEALRRELSRLSDGMVGATSPSSAAQSDAIQRLDRMAKTSRESEHRWAARVKDAEEKLDKFRRENRELMGENERLKEEMTGVAKRAEEGGRRGEELEVKLNRDRGEIDRLVKEKSALVEELRSCRKFLEGARANQETMNREFERRWKEQAELHRAELEKLRVKKTSKVDRGTDAVPFSDEKMEAALAQITQENVTLQEENAGVSAENERLAKRCVDLERSLNEAISDCNDVRGTVERAEARIVDLVREKADREENICRIEQELAAALSEEETVHRTVDEVRAEKEAIEEQLNLLQIEKEQYEKDLQSLERENEMLQSQKNSLEEYHVNAQDELRSWQLAKEEVETELSALQEENEALRSSNLAMKERLEERQTLIDTIRKGESDGPLVEENRMLRSSLAGLENQLRGYESSLQREQSNLTSAEHAREQAEKRIGELENQIVSLQRKVEYANSKITSEQSAHRKLEKQMIDMRNTIQSLREEISSAAIAKSELELELHQRQEECATLRKQLDPVQKEKYRLQLDNATLSEEIENLRKQDSGESRAELVKRLEEKNDALAECINNLQNDMMAMHSSKGTSSGTVNANTPLLETPSIQPRVSTFHELENAPRTLKTNPPTIPRHMWDELNRARAAVKETGSIIKSQRQNISSDYAIGETHDPSLLLSPNTMRASDASLSSSHFMTTTSSVKPPAEITTALYDQVASHHQRMSANRAIAPSPSFDGRTNLQMQLEEEHIAEKSAIKTKYRERIRCMKKEWEGERKAILSLIASPNVEESDEVYRIVKSPVQRVESVPQQVVASKETRGSTCDTDTVESSYLETETFVLNILNELECEK